MDASISPHLFPSSPHSFALIDAVAPDFLPVNPPSVRPGAPHEDAPGRKETVEQQQKDAGNAIIIDADDSPEASVDEEGFDDELSEVDETFPQPGATRRYHGNPYDR
ncbi:unnamed protein product [Penicillium discolor]